MSKPIVLFSGGLDSTTLLWKLLVQHRSTSRVPIPAPKAISFDYGQRHSHELDQAFQFCKQHNIEHVVCDLDTSVGEIDEDYPSWKSVHGLIAKGSQSGSDPVPEGHYAEESMKTTIVPNRNMIMLSIAVGWAQATGSTEVFYAAHAGDHAIYPDCRPEFFELMSRTVQLSSWPPIVQLRAPFIGLSKSQIVQQGHVLGCPYELTYSCYKGGAKHCGKCGTCVERREAFQLAGVPDPTEYENGR